VESAYHLQRVELVRILVRHLATIIAFVGFALQHLACCHVGCGDVTATPTMHGCCHEHHEEIPADAVSFECEGHSDQGEPAHHLCVGTHIFFLGAPEAKSPEKPSAEWLPISSPRLPVSPRQALARFQRAGSQSVLLRLPLRAELQVFLL
jgi:hypothetical protein